MNTRIVPKSLLFLIVFALTACSPLAGADRTVEPQQIGSYPAAEGETTYYPPPEWYPPQPFIRYDATLQLAVWNVDSAAEEAAQISGSYGGYLASSRLWFQDSQKHITLVLAVPAGNFHGTHQALSRLGVVESDFVTGTERDGGYGVDEWTVFSHITVYLGPRGGLQMPDLSLSDWRPARTFAQAFSVFVTVFGFLVDIVIWVGVVVGPFLLVGWLGLKWARRRSGEKESEAEVRQVE